MPGKEVNPACVGKIVESWTGINPNNLSSLFQILCILSDFRVGKSCKWGFLVIPNPH